MRGLDLGCNFERTGKAEFVADHVVEADIDGAVVQHTHVFTPYNSLLGNSNDSIQSDLDMSSHTFKPCILRWVCTLKENQPLASVIDLLAYITLSYACSLLDFISKGYDLIYKLEKVKSVFDDLLLVNENVPGVVSLVRSLLDLINSDLASKMISINSRTLCIAVCSYGSSSNPAEVEIYNKIVSTLAESMFGDLGSLSDSVWWQDLLDSHRHNFESAVTVALGLVAQTGVAILDGDKIELSPFSIIDCGLESNHAKHPFDLKYINSQSKPLFALNRRLKTIIPGGKAALRSMIQFDQLVVFQQLQLLASTDKLLRLSKEVVDLLRSDAPLHDMCSFISLLYCSQNYNTAAINALVVGCQFKIFTHDGR